MNRNFGFGRVAPYIDLLILFIENLFFFIFSP